jgi:hypothetical protein
MTFDAQEDRDRFEDHTPMNETSAEIQALVNVLTDKKILSDAFTDFIVDSFDGLEALGIILGANSTDRKMAAIEKLKHAYLDAPYTMKVMEAEVTKLMSEA